MDIFCKRCFKLVNDKSIIYSEKILKNSLGTDYEFQISIKIPIFDYSYSLH